MTHAAHPNPPHTHTSGVSPTTNMPGNPAASAKPVTAVRTSALPAASAAAAVAAAASTGGVVDTCPAARKTLATEAVREIRRSYVSRGGRRVRVEWGGAGAGRGGWTTARKGGTIIPRSRIIIYPPKWLTALLCVCHWHLTTGLLPTPLAPARADPTPGSPHPSLQFVMLVYMYANEHLKLVPLNSANDRTRLRCQGWLGQPCAPLPLPPRLVEVAVQRVEVWRRADELRCGFSSGSCVARGCHHAPRGGGVCERTDDG